MVAEVISKKDKLQIHETYTLEEYFQLEEQSDRKNEFVKGKIVPMAGGTYNHNSISGTIHGLLFMLFFFSEKNIKAHNSDQKIYITTFDKITYTDTFVTVGEPIFHQGGNQAITNPTLIVEVASKYTERKDRTTKFRMYQTLPTFKEYVIVNQDMPIVEVFYKIEENKWQMTSYVGLDKVVKFETIDAELKMSDIYKETINLENPQTFIDFLDEEEA